MRIPGYPYNRDDPRTHGLLALIFHHNKEITVIMYILRSILTGISFLVLIMAVLIALGHGDEPLTDGWIVFLACIGSGFFYEFAREIHD